MTDTKRLRELADMSNWYSDEKTELRSLILAACDELERLRDALATETGCTFAEIENNYKMRVNRKELIGP